VTGRERFEERLVWGLKEEESKLTPRLIWRVSGVWLGGFMELLFEMGSTGGGSEVGSWAVLSV
jgi:hypothetical protein